MPLFEVQTIADRVAAQTRQEQLVALLTTFFGAVAALLAAIGLYGVVAYAVTNRRTEFGVRLALGATPGGLRRLVLGDSLLLVTVGLLAGLGTALTVARWIGQMLFGIEPFDPVSFAVSGAMLASVAAIAAWLPARHAARVDPIVVLRSDLIPGRAVSRLPLSQRSRSPLELETLSRRADDGPRVTRERPLGRPNAVNPRYGMGRERRPR